MHGGNCNLETCFLCRNCVPDWKEIIAIKKHTISVRRGKAIFTEGDHVKGIYFLYSGSAKVHMHWEEQKELILRFAREGDVLGHRGFGDTIYPISATAMEDSKVCFISNEFLETTLKTNPSFTYNLLYVYARELQKAEKRMRNLAHMEVKGRIAEALLEIADTFGNNQNGYINITMTRQDIASYAGTTYETVFKFFNDLTNSSIISTSGKSIKIDKPEELRSYIKESA